MAIGHRRAYIGVTTAGIRLAEYLSASLGGDVLAVERCEKKPDGEPMAFSALVAYAFSQYDQIVFVMALGITVRSIAPHIGDKYTDPAIVAVDDLGKHVVSVLSGHVGGANALTMEIAAAIGAEPVITTATDIRGKGAFELYLKDRGIDTKPHRDLSKWVNRQLVEEKPVWIIDEGQSHELPLGCLVGKLEDLEQYPEGRVVYIGEKDSLALRHQCRSVIPERRLVIGLGFRRGKTENELMQALQRVFQERALHLGAIKTFATIGLKANEAGLLALSRTLDIPVIVIPESDIEIVQHLFDGSDFVEKTVGVTSIAEPCAYLASGGHLLHSKVASCGVTVAIGMDTSDH